VSPELVIVLAGSLIGASCALVGTFLVLRGTAMLGDAISHAVLPGIVIAFLVTGARSPLPMLIGAGALGVITVGLVGLTRASGLLADDASIGVVFPALFALGVVLVTQFGSQVDLDLDCVLFGEIAYAPFDTWLIGGTDLGPKALWVGSLILVVDLLLVLLAYKELKLTTFDPALAALLGVSPVLVHYVLMGAVSVTVVGAFESVGAILVVAMLVTPPAAAHLLTDRLWATLLLAVGLAVAAAGLGYLAARWWDASIAGSMAAVAGIELLLAWMLAPRHGLLARVIARRRHQARLDERLVLTHMLHSEGPVPEPSFEALAPLRPRAARRALGRVVARRWAERTDEGVQLTSEGARGLDESLREAARRA
jgi:manganese/zinc/iron transport system permease protein